MPDFDKIYAMLNVAVPKKNNPNAVENKDYLRVLISYPELPSANELAKAKSCVLTE